MTISIDTVRGVATNYGTRETSQKYGGIVPGFGVVREATWTFDYNDLPDADTTKLGVSLPAYAKIVSAKLEILEAFTSTSTLTDLTVGLQQADGTEIDNDGLITAANATEITIAARGNLIAGTGALVGTDIGAAAGELVVAPSVADLLTGKGRVIVEYILEGAGA